jgi:hypothetical protein
LVRALLLLSIVSVFAFCETVSERAASLMDARDCRAHEKLIGLLFENERAYRKGSGYDMVKVAKTLEENGLLKLSLPKAQTVELTFEYGGENPLFFMKMMGDTLRNIGLSFALTTHAALDRDGFVWRVAFTSSRAPSPVILAERLQKQGASIVDIEREDAARWRYRIDMSGAKMAAKPLLSGEMTKIVRPVRTIWLDVSHIKRLSISELPGSHWFPDVVVYDKMLRILSMKQSDERVRHVALSLPSEAAYVKVNDRFTLENIRSGLRVTAKGER